MLVFDLVYTLINSSFRQISKEAAEDGSDISHQYLNVGPMTVTEPGYVYIYVSNENGDPVEVFFDDFSVHLMGTDIVQKDDYYPFGGSFDAYTDLSTPQQDYLYNGVRLNKTTQLYETAFRTYDPYLGRFNHIDPLTAMVPGLSPYHFGFNNPVRYSDPMGLMGDDAGIWGTGNTGGSYANGTKKNPWGYFTGPGSDHHWSDGWENSDWNAWTGSDSYREEKAYAKSSGGFGYGGSFKDGNGYQVKVVNGQLQVWYPMGGDLAYTVEGDGFVDQYYYGAWGDPIGGNAQALQASLFPVAFEYSNAILNAGSTLVGLGEQGLQYVRQYPNGPRDIARGVENLIGKRVGTQATAKFLSNSFNSVKSLGSKLGTFGAVASTTDYIANFNEKNGYDHASYWIGVGVMAVSYSVPIIGIAYGGAQLFSYIYNGKSFEENLGRRMGY